MQGWSALLCSLVIFVDMYESISSLFICWAFMRNGKPNKSEERGEVQGQSCHNKSHVSRSTARCLWCCNLKLLCPQSPLLLRSSPKTQPCTWSLDELISIVPPLFLSFSLIHSLSCLNYLVLSSSSKSPVVSVGFARFHPNLLVGGTYSGQIVLWDNRSHRRTPVQRTPLSAAAHTVRTHLMYFLHTFRLILLEWNATTLWTIIHEEDFNL